MSLTVDYLEVKEFRNYEWFLLELDRGLTIIEGPNAAGKTNLIEALQLLLAGESFRNPRWKDVIREGSSAARASLTASGDGREIAVVLDIDPVSGRSYRLNGSKRRSVSAATGTIPCVLFTPDDLMMVKGPSEARRGSLDSLGAQMSVVYDSLRREYARILRQRNALLKEGTGGDTMEALTEQLVATGVRLTTHRVGLLDKMASRAADVFSNLSGGGELSCVYQRSWEREGLEMSGGAADEDFRRALEATRGRERAKGSTIVGPHRDDVAMTIDGRSARAFASQGQQRTIALSWKLAEVAVIEDVVSQPPLLLLDDVMSELDERRRHALASWVNESVQTVITTTNLHYFEPEMLRSGRVVSLSGPGQ